MCIGDTEPEFYVRHRFDSVHTDRFQTLKVFLIPCHKGTVLFPKPYCLGKFSLHVLDPGQAEIDIDIARIDLQRLHGNFFSFIETFQGDERCNIREIDRYQHEGDVIRLARNFDRLLSSLNAFFMTVILRIGIGQIIPRFRLLWIFPCHFAQQTDRTLVFAQHGFSVKVISVVVELHGGKFHFRRDINLIMNDADVTNTNTISENPRKIENKIFPPIPEIVLYQDRVSIDFFRCVQNEFQQFHTAFLCQLLICIDL